MLAIGTHFLILLIALVAPYIFQYRPPLPEVYTVNLFSVEDTSLPPVARPAPPTVVEPKKIKVKKSEPVAAPPPPPVAKSAPEKVISLKTIPTKSKKEEERVKRLRDMLLAQEKAKKAQELADKKAKDALESLKNALAAQNKVTGKTEKNVAPAAPRAGSGVEVDENTRRYLIAVNNHVQEHWVLPDLQNWADDLEAIMVIRVRRDGVVAKSFFEKKSSNLYFNQFVEKAIKEASPLPPFPIGLTDNEMEIGLRFRPGEVF